MQATSDIPETFDGTLSLTICDAELKNQESKDPYCKISLGSSKLTQRLKEGESWGKERYTTQTKPEAGNHPVWNESHDFSMHKMKQDSHLKIKLYDRDVLKNDYLGLAKIDLSELVQNLGKGEKQYYQLLNKENFSIGRIGIITKFVGLNLSGQEGHEVGTGDTDLVTGQPAHAKHRSRQKNIEDSQTVRGKDIPGGVPDHTQGKDNFEGLQEKGAVGGSSNLADKFEEKDTLSSGTPSDKDKLKASDFATTQSKLPDSATLKTQPTSEISTSDRYEVQPGIIRDESGSTSAGKKKFNEVLIHGKEKLNEAAGLVGPTYRRAMPEALGGGYLVQPGIIKDETGKIISHQEPSPLENGKETLNQVAAAAKESYKENMPKAQQTAQSLWEKGKEKLTEAAILAGPLYRATMPEALGGGYPVEPGIIKDENGNILNERAPMQEERADRPVKTEDTVVTETSFVDKAKSLYSDVAPEALGGRTPTLMERVHQGYKPGTTEEDTSLIGNVKALAAETLPESLGGRPPTLGERLKAEPTIAGKVQVLKEETLPETLGGRPTTWHEKKGTPEPMRSGDSVLATVKKVYTETAPEALGGRPATVKEKAEQVVQPSLLDRAKETYKDTMPEALGGRPSVTEHLKAEVEDKVEMAKDKVKSSVQPSLLDRAKETYKETMPEALGGRPSVAADKVEEIDAPPSLIERMKHTITETLPEVLGVRSAHVADTEVPTTTATVIQITEIVPDNMPDENMPDVKDVQRAKSRVNEQIRQRNSESTQNIEHVQGSTDNIQSTEKSQLHQTIVQNQTTANH